MNPDAMIEYRSPALIRKIGLEALRKALGPVEMASFLRQYDLGEGDYTKDREQWLSGITMEEVMEEIKKLQ